MRHRLLPLLAAPAVLLTGCFVGPHQLRRSVDDWDHRLYVENPWLDVGLWVVPVIPVTSLLAAVGDFLITDPIAFLGGDAWRGNGTGFAHTRVEPVRWYESLLHDRSGWMRRERHDDPTVPETPPPAPAPTAPTTAPSR